jgi:SAM-dependent methyltransferase
MSLAHRISSRNRDRKWQLFLDEFKPHAALRVLDVGFTAREFSSVDNYIEKHYPFPEQLTALSLESPVEFAKRYPKVRTVQFGGGRFPFADQEFDVCWSNAVVEHVGGRAQQLAFIKEIRRVAKRAFFTTPNRHFPIEVHTRTPFLHWLPGRGWAAGDYMDLLTVRDMRKLLAEAAIDEYKIVRNKLFGFTMDFVVVL